MKYFVDIKQADQPAKAFWHTKEFARKEDAIAYLKLHIDADARYDQVGEWDYRITCVEDNKFFDMESEEVLTEDQLSGIFDILKAGDPVEYDYDFSAYIRNCTNGNGFMITLEKAMRRAAKELKYWHAERFEYVEEWREACAAWNKLYPHDTEMGNRILQDNGLWKNGRFWY